MNETSSPLGDSWTSRYEALREGIRGGGLASGTALVLRVGVVGWLEEGDRLPSLPTPLSCDAAPAPHSRPAAAVILANVATGAATHHRSSLGPNSLIP